MSSLLTTVNHRRYGRIGAPQHTPERPAAARIARSDVIVARLPDHFVRADKQRLRDLEVMK
jgi:hypothetical protein